MAHPADEGAPVAAGVRALLLLAALLVFLAGVQLFVFPLRTDEYFAWTIASPMTAVFLGASYWSAIGLELMAARSPRWSGARIAIPAVFAFTTITLVVSLIHLDLFHLDHELSLGTRGVTWAWLAVYTTVPILLVLAVVCQRRLSTAVPAPAGLPRTVQVVLVALAVLLLGLGAALLLSPSWADGAWPWALTPLTGRAIGAWLVGLGTALVHARVLDDRPSLRPLAVTGLLFGALQAIALLRHGDELDGTDVQSVAYVVVLVVLSAVSAWALWPRPSHRRARTAGDGATASAPLASAPRSAPPAR